MSDCVEFVATRRRRKPKNDCCIHGLEDVAALEALLQGPRNPNVMDEDGHGMP